MDMASLVVICAIAFAAGMIFSAALIRGQQNRTRKRRQAFIKSRDGRSAAMRDMARALDRYTTAIESGRGYTIYKGESNLKSDDEFINQLRKDLSLNERF